MYNIEKSPDDAQLNMIRRRGDYYVARRTRQAVSVTDICVNLRAITNRPYGLHNSVTNK